ncbi:MAG TPA: GNAT family N-acetyltransferase [Gaiellaceae bacterium]|nr:GNAT family N-acetyltransferase [Gaiellaceae bacterium]
MKLTVRPASAETFAEMEAWRYGPPYDFYDGDVDPVLNPERFYAALGEDGGLVGFYYFEEKGDALEIGLGLRPELTGRGLGLEFFRAGLAFGRRRFRPARMILNVAAFNERAITVYERAGFRETGRHVRHFERWGDVEFVEMEEQAKPR